MNESMSYSDFREHLKVSLDKVCDNHMPLLVTRKNGENVVVISEDDYKSMDETAYLMASPNNAKMLLEALHRDPKERIVFNSIEELENYLGFKSDEN
jgi:antitoxin YefM